MRLTNTTPTTGTYLGYVYWNKKLAIFIADHFPSLLLVYARCPEQQILPPQIPNREQWLFRSLVWLVMFNHTQGLLPFLIMNDIFSRTKSLAHSIVNS